jgi:hypothetical protein
MRRRKNAPISRRDKAALRRILKTHKGRGNRSNPKRGKKSRRWRHSHSKGTQKAARAQKRWIGKHRRNPKRGKRSRRYQRGAAQGLGRKHLRKMTAHGRHLDRYGHRSTARSRRRTRR